MPDEIRLLTLNEVPGAGGPLEALVNNSKWAGYGGPDGNTPILNSFLVNGPNQGDFSNVTGNHITEFLQEGETEVWEIVNMTADSHPIHLHGLQFQLINREPYDQAGFTAVYDALFPGGAFLPGYGPPNAYNTPNAAGAIGGNPDVTPFLLGLPAPPLNYEAGWKDTVIMHPGEVSRIAVRVAPQDATATGELFWPYEPSPFYNGGQGIYVWHCHITDHEDNEMMRPDVFDANPAAVRMYFQGIDY